MQTDRFGLMPISSANVATWWLAAVEHPCYRDFSGGGHARLELANFRCRNARHAVCYPQVAANRTHLRAGIVLLLVGLPTFLIARKVGETDAVQSDALIWPMILIPASILILGIALLVRGAFGASRNAARQRRSG